MRLNAVLASMTVAAAIAGCTETTTTQLAQNMVRIDVSAAPACGSSGAKRLVARMAAVETLRLGFDKYVITGMDNQNNVRVIGANFQTTGTLTGLGNTATYSGTTTATPIIAGSQASAVVLVMFKAGDPQGANAIDARSQLGPDWATIVEAGAPTTCLD